LSNVKGKESLRKPVTILASHNHSFIAADRARKFPVEWMRWEKRSDEDFLHVPRLAEFPRFLTEGAEGHGRGMRTLTPQARTPVIGGFGGFRDSKGPRCDGRSAFSKLIGRRPTLTLLAFLFLQPCDHAQVLQGSGVALHLTAGGQLSQ
jgi:hypothetical protein